MSVDDWIDVERLRAVKAEFSSAMNIIMEDGSISGYAQLLLLVGSWHPETVVPYGSRWTPKVDIGSQLASRKAYRCSTPPYTVFCPKKPSILCKDPWLTEG